MASAGVKWASSIALSILIGFGMAIQATVNTRCGVYFGVSTLGVSATFGVAVPLLTIITLIESRTYNLGYLTWKIRPQWWHLMPGVMGTCYVLGGALVTAQLGSALFFIPLILGQLSQSALLDHYGLSTADGSRKVVTPAKAVALAFAASGAVLCVLERLTSNSSKDKVSPAATAGYLIVAFLVGTMTPAQAAISRCVIPLVPSKLQATWWTFSIGGLVTAIVVGSQLAANPTTANAIPALASGAKFYMFSGGLFGIAYIASSIYFAPIIGSAPYFVSLVSGQLAGSAFIDSTGAFDSPRQTVTILHAAGVVMVLIASSLLAAIGHSQALTTTTTTATIITATVDIDNNNNNKQSLLETEEVELIPSIN
jgi:transporter family-2 protein